MDRLTKEQAVVVSAYTMAMACDDFGDVKEYAEKKLGRPVSTHDFLTIHEELQEACKEDFLAICFKGEDNGK